MPAQAVIFDVDGTLVDSVDLHARAWQEALAHFGHRVAFDEVRAQIGKGGDQLLPVFLSEDEISLRGKLIEDYRGDLYKREYLKRVRAFPGVRPLFKELLRRGLRIALASSAKGDELAVYEQIAGIEGLLHAQTSKDDAEKSKPHPDIFEAALRRLGPDADPHRTFVVGDTPWDAIAARRTGVRTIGVLCGGFAQADLVAAGCVAIYRDPEDLHIRLERSPLVS
ncbi:MAG TPA: HAD family hydrolase [Myxococcales bacterium]|nr:HAD family hydrolase [Myxococcales bacterium]